MADEAFALSPISARATQPSESDYDAIREAFMETSRGRWFLGEYAKRNRNADTTMVLDAVARIEETLAAQRQPPEPENPLPEALAAIRSAVDRAVEAASAAIDGLGLEESLAPIRKGARIIKEISWRWREIGADSRICDLIDSQVSAIEASCGQISEINPRPGLSGAFDLIRSRIDGLAQEDNKDDNKDGNDPIDDNNDDDKAVAPAADEVATSIPPITPEPVAAVPPIPTEPVAAVSPITTESVAAVAPTMEPVAATTIKREPELSATDSVAMAAAEPDLLQDLPQDLPITAAVSTVEVADKAVVAANADDAEVLDAAALDEAVLDMVALEMAAPDPDGGEDYANADDDEVFEPAPATTTMAVEAPAAVAPAAVAPVQAPRPEAVLQPAAQPSFAAPSQPSIGSALLANGFLDQHRAPANDPLAPIRRMSQAEKIALFS